MNLTLIFIAVSFLMGLACGYGIDKLATHGEKITAAEYQLIVQKINNDVTIASDLKIALLNQLYNYTHQYNAGIDGLHIALRGLIEEVKNL
jgi:hypothetical protein